MCSYCVPSIYVCDIHLSINVSGRWGTFCLLFTIHLATSFCCRGILFCFLGFQDNRWFILFLFWKKEPHAVHICATNAHTMVGMYSPPYHHHGQLLLSMYGWKFFACDGYWRWQYFSFSLILCFSFGDAFRRTIFKVTKWT